jgi:type II secretory ATPase GspE/PulE/Tfp pilus assembly ATPase PilB-like protein
VIERPDKRMSDLARLLVERNLLSADTLEELVDRADLLSESIDLIIAREKIVPEEDMVALLSEITGIPTQSKIHAQIELSAVESVPARVVARYRVMPVSVDGDRITLATDSVREIKEEDELRVLLNLAVDWVLCSSHEVSECIRHYYGVAVASFLNADESSKRGGEEASADARDISTFVGEIIRDAMDSNASDIHFEPYEDGDLRLRYRIDGVLCAMPLPDGARRLQKAIVSSTKVMAQLNIAETRLPQDGRFSISVGDEPIDIRVSVLPSQNGQALNMRLLNRQATFLDVRQLNIPDDQLNAIGNIVAMPNGVILFTGPTGSGKTTSLYATLAELNNSQRKIITIEDPVEYRIAGITQMQVKPDIGFTFASGLRSILRHDPDVVLVGEIRDGETASIAVSAALTGHMVLSTLHTNDSASAAMRLVDMGVEPYLVTSTLRGVVAQRLLRGICPACKEQIQFDPQIRTEVEVLCPKPIDDVLFYNGKGCPDCRFTGYSGRRAIFEVLVLDDDIRSMIVDRAPSTAIMRQASKRGMSTLSDSGWDCALKGFTTIEEVMRVTNRE